MNVVNERCCGLDIHKKVVAACVLLTEPDGQARKMFQTVGTMTDELLELAAWLKEQGVTQVAMRVRACTGSPSCATRRHLTE